jgi:hypothetical protein
MTSQMTSQTTSHMTSQTTSQSLEMTSQSHQILKEARQLLGGESLDASRFGQFYAQFDDDDAAREDVDVKRLSEEASPQGEIHEQTDYILK